MKKFELIVLLALFSALLGLVTFTPGCSLPGKKWGKAECNEACSDAGFKFSTKRNWACYCGNEKGKKELEL